MAKKKSCKRTVEENIIHDRAVKIRKRTYEQIVQGIENICEKGQKEGLDFGKDSVKKSNVVNIPEIIEEIGNIKGIGNVKLIEIKKILDKHLEVYACE